MKVWCVNEGGGMKVWCVNEGGGDGGMVCQ